MRRCLGNSCKAFDFSRGLFTDINVEDGQAVARETGALFVEGNTRNREDLEKAVAAAIEKYGELDCVVANAGIHRCNTMLTISEEDST